MGTTEQRRRLRWARRSPEQRECLELQRELGRLASTYSRFRPQLNQLMVTVRRQLTSEAWKRRQVINSIRRWGMLSAEEISDDLGLDLSSVRAALQKEIGSPRGKLEATSRDGRAVIVRANGRLWTSEGTAFYRLRSQKQPGNNGGLQRSPTCPAAPSLSPTCAASPSASC
jgi:hypothetical protein